MPRTKPSPVLILEDDELLRLTLAEELRAEGIEVFEARSEVEACTLLEANPDIGNVVTDVNLKGEPGGLRFCSKVQADNPRCRIIIASGQTIAEGTVPGALILPKPYEVSDVLAGLR